MKSNLPTACYLVQMLFLLLLLQGSHKTTVFGYVRSPMTTVRNPSWKIPTTTTTTMAPFALGSRNSNTDQGREGNQMQDDEEDEIFSPTRPSESDIDKTDTNKDSFRYMDDLTPPPVNFARNSILFSENPSTKLRNNSALEVWKFTRNHFPALLTGAWPWRDIPHMDQQPLAALYNMLIVRLPVLAVMVAYLYQKILQNHDLVIDLGFDSNGPQAVPPVLVIAVLVLILL